jgi:hypothetical protein
MGVVKALAAPYFPWHMTKYHIPDKAYFVNKNNSPSDPQLLQSKLPLIEIAPYEENWIVTLTILIIPPHNRIDTICPSPWPQEEHPITVFWLGDVSIRSAAATMLRVS